MNKLFTIILSFFVFGCGQQNDRQSPATSSDPVSNVNVFLGTSGDHGQMSPSASYPFGMLSIGPQTYPAIHPGYEHLAKEFLGFTHTRIEGVGCQGSGGNILIKPFLGNDPDSSQLVKQSEAGSPGYYQVGFDNGIGAEFAVNDRFGLHHYTFPNGKKGLYIDLGYALVNRFVDEQHEMSDHTISGWVDTQTTCSAGVYRLYFTLSFDESITLRSVGEHTILASIADDQSEVQIRVGLSSVNAEYADKRITDTSFEAVKSQGSHAWNDLLSRIQVKGSEERTGLFYSLLYRAMHSPYNITEPDGHYRAIDGSVQQTKDTIYNGWAIWDNYREQLPLLSLAYPEKYQHIASSIANLYPYGKNNWATRHEPSPTVRTEHAMVVLLDAYRKGYDIPFNNIMDSLLREAETLDYGAPDKALESSYDAWAMAEILHIAGNKSLSEKYRAQAAEYKKYWKKDFADLSQGDVDRMQARGLYQGTIWQYRWFVPFDVKGLKELIGGEQAYIDQLNTFFAGDYYNHANQPDLQVPGMYNASEEPYQSQALFHQIAVDTTVQFYFNDNSKGIDPYIGKIYQNKPQAYVRTMDDDAGTMSSWFVLTSCGLSPACVGWPVYYLNAPLFEEVSFQWPNGKTMTIRSENFAEDHAYIQSAKLNGEPLNRNWLTQEEITGGGELVFTLSDKPAKNWGTDSLWVSDINE